MLGLLSLVGPCSSSASVLQPTLSSAATSSGSVMFLVDRSGSIDAEAFANTLGLVAAASDSLLQRGYAVGGRAFDHTSSTLFGSPGTTVSPGPLLDPATVVRTAQSPTATAAAIAAALTAVTGTAFGASPPGAVAHKTLVIVTDGVTSEACGQPQRAGDTGPAANCVERRASEFEDEGWDVLVVMIPPTAG